MNPLNWSPDQWQAVVLTTAIAALLIAGFIFVCALDSALAADAKRRHERLTKSPGSKR